MLDKIKTEIYTNLQMLFAEAVVNEMTGDTAAYKNALNKITAIADILGISTEVIQVNINIKTDKILRS